MVLFHTTVCRDCFQEEFKKTIKQTLELEILTLRYVFSFPRCR